MKVLVVFYSLYGHIYKMAEAVKEGAESVAEAEVGLARVPETLPEEVLQKMGGLEFQKSLDHVPICTLDDLARFRQTGLFSALPPDLGTCVGRCASMR
jgi:NAD(P)H dehydrogenase (quinone)